MERKAKKVGRILKTWITFYLIPGLWQQNDWKRGKTLCIRFFEELSTAIRLDNLTAVIYSHNHCFKVWQSDDEQELWLVRNHRTDIQIV